MLIQKQRLKKFLMIGGLLCISHITFSTKVIFGVIDSTGEGISKGNVFKIEVNGKELNNSTGYVESDIYDNKIAIGGISMHCKSDENSDGEKIPKVISYLNRNSGVTSILDINKLIAKYAGNVGKTLYEGGHSFDNPPNEREKLTIFIILDINNACESKPYYNIVGTEEWSVSGIAIKAKNTYFVREANL